MAAMRALYGDGAYGHPSGGTVASLRAITRADIEGTYRSAWAPANATLILSGDIDPARARALAERHFGGWNAQATAATAAASNANAPVRGTVVVIDMPGSGQAAVAVAREGLSRRIAFYKCVALVEGTNIVRRELGLSEARIRAADPKLWFAGR